MLSMLTPTGTCLDWKNDVNEPTHAQFRDACAGQFLSTTEDNPVRQEISCGPNSLTVVYTDITVYLHRLGLLRPTGQAAWACVGPYTVTTKGSYACSCPILQNQPLCQFTLPTKNRLLYAICLYVHGYMPCQGQKRQISFLFCILKFIHSRLVHDES